ncbi:hypothetical protein G6F22_018678 [Rhizopus arrhizus]|nr:hypothetical protein G6F22_018678 [Rhizopus arrhizus]
MGLSCPTSSRQSCSARPKAKQSCRLPCSWATLYITTSAARLSRVPSPHKPSVISRNRRSRRTNMPARKLAPLNTSSCTGALSDMSIDSPQPPSASWTFRAAQTGEHRTMREPG